MYVIKQSQLVGAWLWYGGAYLLAAVRTVVGDSLSLVQTVLVDDTDWEAHERSLSFEERLQRTGRIRYR